MFRNYLKTAFRNLLRNKGFSFINIAGLTLGITACLIIGLFVWDEKQYDTMIPDGNRIYRVYNISNREEGSSNIASTPPRFGSVLQEQFPAVETSLRIMQKMDKALIEANGKKMYEDEGIFAEPSFFNVFPLPLKYGSKLKALDDPKSIVISEELSEKYFGNENPVGQEIKMNNNRVFVVKAVLKNKNLKFHLSLDYILPMATAQISPDRMKSWQWQQFYTYVKLKKDADVKGLQAGFYEIVKKEAHPITSQSGSTYSPIFQPLLDVHLYAADFKFDMAVKGNITYVKALSYIAAFILLIACFNFINLATARSLKRAKEIGVRKSVGAFRKQLIFQFIGETVLLAFISVLISVGISMLLLTSLNQFTGKQISYQLFAEPATILLLIGLTLLVGLISGFYPAIVLSGFNPVRVLKGSNVDVNPGRIQWLRKGLVITQFALSGLLIISVMIVYKQVNYLHNKDLGFNKEEILFFPMQGQKMFQSYETFKNELAQAPGVSSVSIGYGFPGDMVAGDEIIVPGKGEAKHFSSTHLMVDYDYLKTLGLELVAGRDFSKEIKTDKDEAFIINETAVKELGFGDPQKALGQRLEWTMWNDNDKDTLKKGQVIGVVKDFHYKSLYDKLTTAVIQIFPYAYWKVAVKLKTANLNTTLASIKTVWSRYSPEFPIEYKFLDENFEQMYKSEDKLRSLLFIFTGVAIFIACLGLFGLAAYSAERRKKEIGIRKVLGASTQNIAVLLSKDFLLLVLIAIVVASPIAWYFMSDWLQHFEYRISINWTIFIIAALAAILIALITVSFQAIKAAIANPVKSLRTE